MPTPRLTEFHPGNLVQPRRRSGFDFNPALFQTTRLYCVGGDIYGLAPGLTRNMSGTALHTTTNRRGSANRNAAFTLQFGAMLTSRQP